MDENEAERAIDVLKAWIVSSIESNSCDISSTGMLCSRMLIW